jgi:hypothetical protein
MTTQDKTQSFVQAAVAAEREQWTGPSGTDRELLELAAEAAGIDHLGFHADGLVYAHNWDCSDRYEWNPLTNDGDALRLATRLCMSVSTGPCEASANTIAGALRGAFFREETIQQDHGEAVRRVIVRAAAEIGVQS